MSQQGYIGRNPGDGRTIVNRQTTHVTTGVQTSFTMTTGYEVGYLDVYLNGIKQTETLDYTASDGSTINFALSFPPVNGDVLEFVAFETLNITNIKSARRNFSVGQDLDVSGKVTIGSSLTVASDLVVNGTFTTINTEILDVEDKTVGIASTSSPSNTTADGAGIVIYGGSDGDKSLTWNSTKSNFVLVGGGVSIGTGVTISTPADNVLAFSVNSAEKARFNNFGAFTVGYEGEAWHESTYVGVLQAGSGAWIGQTPGASARAEWTNNAYYDSVNTRWEYIAADEANRIVLENGELKLQSADAGSADGAITWNEKLKMTVGGDFKIGAPTGIGITISSSGNVDSIGIVTASSFDGNLNASQLASGTVPTARLGSGTASSSTFLRGDSTFQTVNTDLVSDTSPQLGGGLESNGFNINFADSNGSNNAAKFGASGDLMIYHDSVHSRLVDSGTGDLKLQSSKVTIGNAGNSETMATFTENGAVELYQDNTKVFNTSSGGVTVSNGTSAAKITVIGGENQRAIVELLADDGDDNADYWQFQARTDGNLNIQNYNTGSWVNSLILRGGGAAELYHDNVKTFETENGGVAVTDNDTTSYIKMVTSGGDAGYLHGLNNSEMSLLDREGHYFIRGTKDGATDLYYDNSIKLSTLSNGAQVQGRFSCGDDNAPETTFQVTATAAGAVYPMLLKNRTNGNAAVGMRFIATGADLSDGDFASIEAGHGAVGSTNHEFRFKTCHSGTVAEKLRLTSDGKLAFNYAASPSNEDVMICGNGQANPAGVTLSHLSGGNRYGLRLQTISGTNAGISFSPVINSSYNESMRIVYINANSVSQVRVGGASGDFTSPFTTSTIFNVQRTNGNVASFYHHGTNNNPVIIVRHQRSGSSGNSGVNFQFNNTNGSAVGYILSNASSTTYQTSSDYRLKENAVAISDGITRLKTLKPYRFNFKVDSTTTVDGFFAHEVTAVPEAVSGTKDEVVTQAMLDSGDAPSESKLNDPIYQGIDQSKLVPLLTAALQEAVTKIETLETEVSDLKTLIKNSSSFAALKSSL